MQNDKIWKEVKKWSLKNFLQVNMTAVFADQYDDTEGDGLNIFAPLRSFEKNDYFSFEKKIKVINF